MASEPHAPLPGLDLAADAPLATFRARRVRMLLRDQRLLDGMVHLPEDGDLATYLSTREGGWVNVTEARWLASGERVSHLLLKASVVLWAGAAAGDEQLLPRQEGTPRPVKITLENRITLHADLRLPVRRRLTDVLTACGDFFPVCDARVDARGIAFGDVAVNRDAVHVVEDLADMPAADEPSPFDKDVTTAYLAGAMGGIVDPFRPVTLDELELAALSRTPGTGYAIGLAAAPAGTVRA